MAGLEGLPLLPIDPTKTGESEITEHLRDTLQEVKRRKLDASEKEAADKPAEAPKKAKAPEVQKTCVHEVALPPSGWTGTKEEQEELLNPRYTGEPAKTYPFTLDPFQSTAVACLERRESVLVAAHTSAGKTVVAEYAIAMAFRDKQKVIYTSPLKALSNQKFRELQEEFEDVGLMTGDVVISPNAACLVMTTEILRSMTYRGSAVLADVAWVIFDEVHYMTDRERGVVWEECIIFTPKGANCVFLSATLPNALEFAEWVAALHERPTHVVYTEYRPTPLNHYGFPAGGGGLYLIVDEQGQFKESNFAKLRETFEAPPKDRQGSAGKGGGRGAGGRGGRGRGRGGDDKGDQKSSEVKKLVKSVMEKNWYPLITFSFSRADCEAHAKAVQALNFNSDEEQSQVELCFQNAIAVLPEEDRDLVQVHQMLPLLRKGIGVHHSGLLPILKELVELLFQESLVKCLFATETFAMGLNMPAKTVIFTKTVKWDGEAFRFLGSGEYIQMSGRAGRRGKDDRGICIIMVDKQLDGAGCKNMILGKSSPLESKFKLTYYTLLNLLKRATGGSINTMQMVIQKSFRQFQHEKRLPEQERTIAELEAKAEEIVVANQESVEEFHRISTSIKEAEEVIRTETLRPERVLPFLVPGRLVRVREGGKDWGWGVALCVSHRPPGQANPKGGAPLPLSTDPSSYYIVDTLLLVNKGSLQAGRFEPAAEGAADTSVDVAILPVQLSLITNLSAVVINLPESLQSAEARWSAALLLKEVKRRFTQGIPPLDPSEDMGIVDPKLEAAVRAVEELEPKLLAHPLFAKEAQQEWYKLYLDKADLKNQAQQVRAQLSQSQVKKFNTELHARTTVLRKLGFVDKDGIVQTKGRAACEIEIADELVATELMFNGVFRTLEPEQLAALCSCFVPTEKVQQEPKLDAKLQDSLAKLREAAKGMGEVQQDAKLELDMEEYVDSFKPTLMNIVLSWCKGASFKEVMATTDLFEGTVVRAVRRLDELLGQLAAAALAVGDDDLEKKFEKAALLLRRGLMFANSLYL